MPSSEIAALEHVNVTVAEPEEVAAMLCRLFGWRIRWQGGSIHGGRSVHVGGESSYLALYSPSGAVLVPKTDSYHQLAGLNHIGLTVADLDRAEAKVRAEGYTPHSHADYEPGRRFYFDGPGGVEIEVVSYAKAPVAA